MGPNYGVSKTFGSFDNTITKNIIYAVLPSIFNTISLLEASWNGY